LRIAYVCYWFLFEKDGVAHKVNAQVAQWRRAGVDAEVFCLARVYPERGTQETDWRTFFFESPLGRLSATRKLVRAVEGWAPDVVYLRYDLFLPPLPALLRRLCTAIEINADDKEEAKLRVERAGLASAYNELNRRALLSRARGLVCVTHELARSPSFASFGKPTEVIANGVDLDALRSLRPAPTLDRPRAAFLGSARQAWHGIDKLAWLATRLPEVDFDIVGYDETFLEEAIGGRRPANLIPHGVLSRREYEPILERCELAFGTLALHRKNMHEACPLKVREYLGYGLPIVIGYEDTDLVDLQPWFVLRLPNEEGNVQGAVSEIRAFLGDVRGRRVPRPDIEGRVGAVAKERRRLAFLRQLSAV